MNAAILAAAAEGVEQATHTELPMDPIFYGIISLAVFLTLGIVTRSWKGISHRH